MGLHWLQVENFRCLQQARIEPQGRNLITGENASGKTSLLEAIFFLGRGRSFRTANNEGVTRDGEKAFTVAGRVEHRGLEATLGLQVSRSGIEARVNGEKAAGLAELAERLPVQVIDPEVHKLIEEGPGRRRKFLDWGVFHVEHRFLPAWRRYQRALKQRNTALKQGAAGIEAWDREFVAAGTKVGHYRRSYVSGLAKYLGPVVRSLLGEDLELSYRPGWKGDRTLDEALAASAERDREYRITHVGPHRADLKLEFAGQDVRGRVSRGQQKLLAAALILAQNDFVRETAGDPGVLLVDDPAAELDVDSLGVFMDQLESRPAQLFITALDPTRISFRSAPAMFHVKHGAVSA